MPRVRMLESVASPTYGFKMDEEVEVSAELASNLIAAGRAEAVRPDTAVLETPELNARRRTAGVTTPESRSPSSRGAR